MKKRMIIMLGFTTLVFGGIFLFHLGKSLFSASPYAEGGPVVTVSAMRIASEPWEPYLSAVGSLRAINDVNVTTEVGGLVTQILFTPGKEIQQGDIMVELNADSEKAQLKALQAAADLAEVNYQRDKAQYAIKGVSKAILDTDLATLKSARADVDQQAAIVAKKTIRAPFTGQVGISEVNLGQYLNPGDKIVPLQSLDPIYADFYLPQQNIPKLAKGLSVVLKTDAYPDLTFKGEITSLDSKVDLGTRNVLIEATLSNPEHKLIPGMYVEVRITTGAPEEFLTVPQTAISYNPYGNIIYSIENKGKNKKGEDVLVAKQVFVTLGETRGDQIQVLKGLKKGDLIVTSGQMKLRNGSRVTINNTVTPPNSPHPHPSNEQG